MNIDEVKSKLGYATLNLNYSEKDGQKTQWLRHWDNENRVAVSIHQETFDKIKANPKLSDLDIQTETLTSATSKQEYTAKRIVAYTPAEHTL